MKDSKITKTETKNQDIAIDKVMKLERGKGRVREVFA